MQGMNSYVRDDTPSGFTGADMPVHAQATMAIWNRAGGRMGVPALYMTKLSEAVRCLSSKQALEIVRNCTPSVDVGILLGYLAKFPDVQFSAKAIHGMSIAKRRVCVWPEWRERLAPPAPLPRQIGMPEVPWIDDTCDDTCDDMFDDFLDDSGIVLALSAHDDPVTRAELQETLDRTRALLCVKKEEDAGDLVAAKNAQSPPPNSPSPGRKESPAAGEGPSLTEEAFQEALLASFATDDMSAFSLDDIVDVTAELRLIDGGVDVETGDLGD